jgi:hypothetical protein
MVAAIVLLAVPGIARAQHVNSDLSRPRPRNT